MIYTELTKKALLIAYSAHKDQVDKSGIPYIFHPYHVAEQVTGETAVCAALLHDVVEDTDVTFEELAAGGIPAEVIEILRLLTHDKQAPYMAYIEKIKESGNETAITVKLADLAHNLDTTRFGFPDAKATSLSNRYSAAVECLQEQGIRTSRGYTTNE